MLVFRVRSNGNGTKRNEMHCYETSDRVGINLKDRYKIPIKECTYFQPIIHLMPNNRTLLIIYPHSTYSEVHSVSLSRGYSSGIKFLSKIEANIVGVVSRDKENALFFSDWNEAFRTTSSKCLTLLSFNIRTLEYGKLKQIIRSNVTMNDALVIDDTLILACKDNTFHETDITIYSISMEKVTLKYKFSSYNYIYQSTKDVILTNKSHRIEGCNLYPHPDTKNAFYHIECICKSTSKSRMCLYSLKTFNVLKTWVFNAYVHFISGVPTPAVFYLSKGRILFYYLDYGFESRKEDLGVWDVSPYSIYLTRVDLDPVNKLGRRLFRNARAYYDLIIAC